MRKRVLSENIAIDDERDILTAFGNAMTGELLRAMLEETPEDVWFRVVKTDDGVARLEMAVLERPRIAANAH